MILRKRSPVQFSLSVHELRCSSPIKSFDTNFNYECMVVKMHYITLASPFCLFTESGSLRDHEKYLYFSGLAADLNESELSDYKNTQIRTHRIPYTTRDLISEKHRCICI